MPVTVNLREKVHLEKERGSKNSQKHSSHNEEKTSHKELSSNDDVKIFYIINARLIFSYSYIIKGSVIVWKS